jgi:hypothetical protein
MKWITRSHVHVDRVACPWLITRFIDNIDRDPIARGLEAIASGYSLRYPEDEENLARQFEVYDALYAWCRLQAAQAS